MSPNNNRIATVATRFVLANPAQITKTIRTGLQEREPQVIIHRPDGKGEDMLENALTEIQQAAIAIPAKVLVLGRYHFLGDGPTWLRFKTRFPKLTIEFKTVHGAKGLEADYVVVLGMQAGKYGFPSEINDDPIIDVVLSVSEGFPHAEERRLFYVALTRARHAVHLIADYAVPSAFLTEILAYEGEIRTRGAAAKASMSCPSCKSGMMVQRTGEYGVFYSCSNYPLCDCKTKACSRCGTGLQVREGNSYVCNNESCGHKERACPSCEDGRLVQRKGPYGLFLGCTNYASGKCSHTENFQH